VSSGGARPLTGRLSIGLAVYAVHELSDGRTDDKPMAKA